TALSTMSFDLNIAAPPTIGFELSIICADALLFAIEIDATASSTMTNNFFTVVTFLVGTEFFRTRKELREAKNYRIALPDQKRNFVTGWLLDRGDETSKNEVEGWPFLGRLSVSNKLGRVA